MNARDLVDNGLYFHINKDGVRVGNQEPRCYCKTRY